MKINITYPQPTKEKRLTQKMIKILKWPFLFSGYICLVINLVTGGKAWSIIVLWSLWIVWSTVISPTLIEYNRISQVIKLITNSCILLIFIDIFLSPGWAVEVVPIVCFSGLTLVGVLFFSDFERQQQNMFPMLLLIIISIICSIIGLIIWRAESRWALAVMGAFAFALLIGCVFKLGPSFIREVKKRFHTH